MNTKEHDKLPEETYFNSDDILCHSDGTPVADGVYEDSNGNLVILEGNSGDIFLPE